MHSRTPLLLSEKESFDIELYAAIEYKNRLTSIKASVCFFLQSATKPISRVLSCAEIYLGESSPKHSSRRNNTPAEQTITHCSNQTLHRVGFTWQYSLLHSGELLPRLSTLTKVKNKVPNLAVYLCCTVPKVALGCR